MSLLVADYVLIFQTNTVIQYRSNMNVAIEAATLLPGVCQVLVYLLICRVFREDIENVIQGYYDRVLNMGLHNLQIRNILIATESRNRKIFLYLNVLLFLSATLLNLVGDKEFSNGLPMITWYPFDLPPTTSWRYYCLFAFQMMELYYAAFFNMTLEVFFLIFLMQFQAELEILQELVRELELENSEEEILSKLNNVMKLYCDFVDGFKRAKGFLKWVAGGEFSAGIIPICMTLYQFHLMQGGGIIALLGLLVIIFAVSFKMYMVTLVATNISQQVMNFLKFKVNWN